MRLPLIALALLLPLPALADDIFSKADLKAGEKLHDQKCTSCHIRMYGGDGSKIYTRDGRMLSDRQELLQRVASCNASRNSGLFPEEEHAIAAWLNHRYYHFDQ